MAGFRMQFLCRRSVVSEGSVSPLPYTRVVSCRGRRENGADTSRDHAPHDKGVAVSLLAFLRCLSARTLACRISGQWHSTALGEHGTGDRPLSELGGFSHAQ